MQDEVESRIPYVRGNIINDKVSTWLSSHVDDPQYTPFFLWLHYMDIHEPYMPESKYVEMVDPTITLSNDEMYDLFKNTLLKRDTSDPKKVEMLRKLYDIHVREVDTYVEEFFKTLERLGLAENTTVIFTSDHGDEFMEHDGLSHDDKLYSELIDVPLFIYGSEEKGTCDALVSTVDIPPTVINLMGLDTVPEFKGQSLLPSKHIQNKGAFAEAINQKSKKGGDMERDVYCYREYDLKLIYRANQDSWEMYDLKEDPAEQKNLAGEKQEFEQLKKKLDPMVHRWKK